MSEYLFSYGTLQQPAVQLRLFGRELSGKKDSLPGYKIVSIEITDPVFLLKEQQQQLKAMPSSTQDDCIDGMAFELGHEELLNADQYEPKGYHRVRVTLASGTIAWMYTC